MATGASAGTAGRRFTSARELASIFACDFSSEIWHSDATLSLDDDSDVDNDNDLNADVARRRIGIEGEILNIFDYQVERELTANRDPWRDVYLNYKQYGFAEVMAGKFKVPFSLDENTSSTNLDFVNRSRIATLLAPGRDVGVMVHGRFLTRGILRYELGLFNEDGSNAERNDTDYVHGDRTVAGRLLAQPFRSTKSVAERSGGRRVVHDQRAPGRCVRSPRADRAR